MDLKWQNSKDRLSQMKHTIAEAGGFDRIEKQHASGKLTARERLDLLFDSGTFVELNDMILSRASDFGMDQKKRLGDAVITGYGYIGGRLVLGVDDTGEGISKDVLEHIFERFNTPSGNNSTGLGLPICKELASLMGGNIDITSEVGKGTTVWVTIPCEVESMVRK